MTVLVGVVSMRANGMTDKSRAAELVETIESLREPTSRYFQDTGQLPREYSGYQGATYHRLALDPGVEGWNGPYIDEPIRSAWNPTGGNVHVYNYAVHRHTGDDGFDLDGDGQADVTGTDACMISFWQVQPGVAELVDRAFDDGIPGSWTSGGRVEYQVNSLRLAVLLFHR
ncbi:MAG: hypothetical protein AAF627_22150 [Myxococcota bacterium]